MEQFIKKIKKDNHLKEIKVHRDRILIKDNLNYHGPIGLNKNDEDIIELYLRVDYLEDLIIEISHKANKDLLTDLWKISGKNRYENIYDEIIKRLNYLNTNN